MIQPAGIVLAGGRSRRMGTDKALMTFEGVPMIQLAVNRFEPVCQDIWISCRKESASLYQPFGQLLFDETEDLGPLGGIYRALIQLRQPILVTPVDTPRIGSDHYERLWEASDQGKDTVCYAHADSHMLEGLVSCWSAGAAHTLAEYLTAGKRSVQEFLRERKVRVISVENEEEFVNVNRLEDLGE